MFNIKKLKTLDYRAITANQICKLLYDRFDGDLDAIMADEESINIIDGLDANIRNIYELVLSGEIPLMEYVYRKKEGFNRLTFETESEYNERLSEIAINCKYFYLHDTTPSFQIPKNHKKVIDFINDFDGDWETLFYDRKFMFYTVNEHGYPDISSAYIGKFHIDIEGFDNTDVPTDDCSVADFKDSIEILNISIGYVYYKNSYFDDLEKLGSHLCLIEINSK